MGKLSMRPQRKDLQMEPLPNALREEIESLSDLRARDLRKKYPELLADMPNCTSNGILRAFIAYRLQERFYGVSLSREAQAWLKGEVVADGVPVGPAVRVTNSQLIRDWNGVRHVVGIRKDGLYEYGGRIFKSLSAVAREITGTRWNGKLFFKVKA